MKLQEVQVRALTPERLAPMIGSTRAERFDKIARRARDMLEGRVVINVNSTPTGGGVAEMLQTLLAYARGAGIDTRWVVINGDPKFFAITKRIHNHLYGAPGDAGPLGPDERAHYENILHANAAELLTIVRPHDIVLLHDPQVAGLVPEIKRVGATVVWRCHVGVDSPNQHVERAWDFLRSYLEGVDAFVFSRAAFAPSWVDLGRVFVIPPSIDPFSPKNQALEPSEVDAVLRFVGLLGGDGPPPSTAFIRADGSPGRIDRHADVLQTGPPPPAEAPLVVQVSRWDHMKDMAGVMTAFAEWVTSGTTAHLLLAGPVVSGVADDPEGGAVLEECTREWRHLFHAQRSRVHLACIPMRDPDEHAVIVNAIQRHAAVVTQKSIAEGFGLTVAEAMWKSKPIVASAVGGIVDQIEAGRDGLLVENPHDLQSFGTDVARLLEDSELAARLGDNARKRAQTEFLGDRHLEQWAKLFATLDGTGTS